MSCKCKKTDVVDLKFLKPSLATFQTDLLDQENLYAVHLSYLKIQDKYAHLKELEYAHQIHAVNSTHAAHALNLFTQVDALFHHQNVSDFQDNAQSLAKDLNNAVLQEPNAFLATQ